MPVIRLTRRGFTLAELLVAMTLGGLTAGIVLKILNTTQRSSQTITERIQVQQNVRDGITYLTTMLRELNAGGGDIVIMDSTNLRYRAMTWTGVLCAPPAVGGGEVLLPVRSDAFFGSRAPDPLTDSVLVYRDNDPATRQDDSWLPGAIHASSAGTCSDGTASTNLLIDILPAAGGEDSVVVGVTPGAPIRGFQVQHLGILSWNGRHWLGQAGSKVGGTWNTPQALLGPIDGRGLRFSYFDSTGTATGTPANVQTIGVVLRGMSPGRARTSTGKIDYLVDSLQTRIALRNNPR